MAKKKAAKPAPAAAPTTEDYRRELVRLVARQLDCAKAGAIGSESWRMAFGTDLDRIEECCYWTQLPHPVPVLTFPATPTDERGERQVPEWTVLDSRPSPMEQREFGMRWHLYRIDATSPDALPAINQLAARVIEEWLAWMNQEGADSLLFMPADYFRGIKRTATQLREWIRGGQLKKHEYRRIGKANQYLVSAVFRCAKAPPAEARRKCDEDWRNRLETNRA